MTNDFSRNLIKGRIAELVFEQMLRDAEAFTVLAFGYENVLPELAHRQHDMHIAETMEIIRRAPDFAVINNDTHDVHLIEVKYMHHMTPARVLTAAERMFASWKPSYLFVATPEAFYFGKVSEIVKEGGQIKRLVHPQIPESLQDRYLAILNDFLPPNAAS